MQSYYWLYNVEEILTKLGFKQATMMDRANAFRQHFDLDQERKYKELNLYVFAYSNYLFPVQS